jgi:hypothetical protein
MLRLVLPKKRIADRMEIFREWAKSNLAVKLWRRPTLKEIDKDFGLWCRHQWKSLEHVHDTAELIKEFAPQFSALKRKKRAQIAAAKSWSKENREKRKKNKKPRLTGISYSLFASSIFKPAPSKK